jgi:autotransporter-associated beta strand protein
LPVLAGPNALVVGQAGFNGSVYLDTPNSFTAGTTLEGGALYPSTGSLGPGNLLVAGGTLYAETSPDVLGPAAKLTIAGGVAYLALPNHHAGGTRLAAGRLVVSDPAALGSGELELAGGVFQTDQTIDRPVTFSGDAVIEGGSQGTGQLTAPLRIIGARTISARNVFTLSGNLWRGPADGGSLRLSSAGTLYLTGAANTYTGGTIIDGDGEVVVLPGSTLGVGSATLLHGRFVDLGGGAVTGTGSMLHVAGGRATILGPSAYGQGTLLTGGILEAGADGALGVGPVMINAGKLVITNGDRTLNNYVIIRTGAQIDLAGNALTVRSLSGTGAVTNASNEPAVLTINETLSPGDGIGTLTVGQASDPAPTQLALTTASRTQIDLQGASHDRLAVAGPVNLGGTLDLLQPASATFALGEQWDVILGSTVTGRFNRVTGLTTTNGLSLAATYLPDRMRITAALPGDLDLNRIVDHDDFVRLYNHFGQTGVGWAEGDLNGDGRISIADFQILERGFGLTGAQFAPSWRDQILAISAQVPEPATAALLMSTAAALLCRKKRPHAPTAPRRISCN